MKSNRLTSAQIIEKENNHFSYLQNFLDVSLDHFTSVIKCSETRHQSLQRPLRYAVFHMQMRKTFKLDLHGKVPYIITVNCTAAKLQKRQRMPYVSLTKLAKYIPTFTLLIGCFLEIFPDMWSMGLFKMIKRLSSVYFTWEYSFFDED